MVKKYSYCLLAVLFSHDVLFCMQNNKQLTQQQKQALYCLCNNSPKTVKLIPCCHVACVPCIRDYILQEAVLYCNNCDQDVHCYVPANRLQCPICSKNFQLPFYIESYLEGTSINTYDRIVWTLKRNDLIKESPYSPRSPTGKVWENRLIILMYICFGSLFFMLAILACLGPDHDAQRLVLSIFGGLAGLSFGTGSVIAVCHIIRQLVGECLLKYREDVY